MISCFSWFCGLSQCVFCLFHLGLLVRLHSVGILTMLEVSRNSAILQFMLFVSPGVAVSRPCGLLFSSRLEYMASFHGCLRTIQEIEVEVARPFEAWALKSHSVASLSFFFFFLVRISHKASPNSTLGEIKSTFWWVEWQSHCIGAWKDLSISISYSFSCFTSICPFTKTDMHKFIHCRIVCNSKKVKCDYPSKENER